MHSLTLYRTAQDEPTPVAGMPELYGHMHKLLTAAAPFFYLSASPYNLYSFLRSFRDAHYPYGQLVLRDASWQSIPGLLSNLTLGTQEYKVSRMRKMHDWLPGRSMICIGDSTQTDPESYGACVFVRRTTSPRLLACLLAHCARC